MAFDRTLVNSMYPLDYFGLANVQRIKYPDRTWWSSRGRFATVDPSEPSKYLALSDGGTRTSEYLEIDLGRLREINYLNFQVMRSPVDIHIDYDTVASDDGTHEWVPVEQVEDMPFDNVVHFDPDARNAWFNAQFYFTDSEGNQVSTRFLRIRFARRHHAWPTKTSNPFRWPVSVKALRTARYIATLKDTVGPLINTGAGDAQVTLDVDTNEGTFEIRQRFTMPTDYLRDDISPAMMGFSFETNAPNVIALGQGNSNVITLDDMQWKWSIFDVTDPLQSIKLRTGVTTGAQNGGVTWVNVFFDPAEPLSPDPAKTYELRLHSLNADAATTVFAVTYNTTSPMPGGHEAQQIHSDGTTETLTSTCLSMRVWGDVAESGTDVLGNQYRYGVRRDGANNVYDNSKVGWMCEPQPSPEAVESLYFDVRVPDPTNDTRKIPSVIDAFQVVPRTQGVRMHVYYTDHGLSGRPQDRDDWDNLIWTPVNVTYTLRGGNQIIELPQSIRTTYIKLEFSRLQPQPFRLPTYPKLPVKEYHRYPTWVEEQFANTEFKRTINDWFVRNQTPRMRRVLDDLSDPVQEFQYKEREFLASLSTGDLGKRFANSQFVDVKDRALVDPITGSKLFIDEGRLYSGTLTANVDRSSVLGALVSDRFDPTLPNTVVEGVVNKNRPVAPKVSSSNDRIAESFAFLASTPMWFNRRCRHHYKIERAAFNKQAYFVGVSSVQFFRKDYTTRRDDSLIMDNLHDGHNLDENTFLFDSGSAIWRALPPYQTQNQQGLTLYVSYSINPTYTDEPITFYASASGDPTDIEPVTLQGTGGAAYAIIVSSEPGGQGTIYQPGVDYDISYGTDPDTGETTNIISIGTLSTRAVASTFQRQIDAEQVVGRAVISAVETTVPTSVSTFEAGTFVGVALPSGVDTMAAVDAATVTGVAAVHQSGFIDAALVIGAMDQTSAANSFEQYISIGGVSYTDAFTETGVAVITAVDAHDYVDAAPVTGAMSTSFAVSAVNTTDFIDPYFITSKSNAGAGVAIRQGAVGSNLVDTQALYATVPDANILSVWVPWAQLQPTGTTDFSGWASVTSGGHTLDDSFDHAAAHGYKIIFRVSCGADAPSWLYASAGANVARAGGDHGGGFTQSSAIDPLNAGRMAAGGDTWGIHVTNDGGDSWHKRMKGFNVTASGSVNGPVLVSRALAFSKRPATSGLLYAGQGMNHATNGSGYFATLPMDETQPMHKGTAIPGFGTNIVGNINQPRPAGQLIVSEYVGGGTDTEYVYCLTPLGLMRTLNSNSQTPGDNATTLAFGGTPTSVWRWMQQIDANTLYCVAWDQDFTGANVNSIVYKVVGVGAPLATATPGQITVTQLTGNPTRVHAIKLIGGNIYAACIDGVYVVTGGGNTWTKISGTFFTGECYAIGGTGSTIYAVNKTTGAQPTQTICRTTAGAASTGADWSYIINGTNCINSIWGDGHPWWLYGVAASPDRVNANPHTGSGSPFVASNIEVDPFDSTKITAWHNGAWQSRDGGATWRPSMKGLNGGEKQLMRLDGPLGAVTTQDTDYVASQTTDRYVSAVDNQSPGAFTGPSSLTRTVGGVTYTINPSTPADITKNGVSIADEFFRNACVNPYDMQIDPQDGTIYISQSGGGTLVIDPGTPAVTKLTTLANDGSGPISLPLPWDANLLTAYQNLLDLLAAKFHPTNASGLTLGGTRRSDQVLFMAVAMPTEQGTEMTLGYGGSPSYLGSATLFGQGAAAVAGSITAVDTSIKLQGSVTGYAAPMLLKIDSELMYCSAFNAGTKVATVVRGFSGSAAAGHNTGAAITYLDQTAGGAWPTTQGVTGTYSGTTGIFENQTLNRSVWESAGRTVASNQANMKSAWLSAIDAHSSHFTSITNIPSCVAVGSIFIDGYANATAIASARASSSIWFMTTNLQPGRIVNSNQIAAEVAAGNSGAALNDPTRFDTSGTLKASYYEAWSTAPAAAIQAAVAAGGIVGFQTAGQSVFNNFNTPYAGAGKAFRVILEDALATYDPVFIEINTTLATTNNPAAGVTDTTYHYLFGV